MADILKSILRKGGVGTVGACCYGTETIGQRRERNRQTDSMKLADSVSKQSFRQKEYLETETCSHTEIDSVHSERNAIPESDDGNRCVNDTSMRERRQVLSETESKDIDIKTNKKAVSSQSETVIPETYAWQSN